MTKYGYVISILDDRVKIYYGINNQHIRSYDIELKKLSNFLCILKRDGYTIDLSEEFYDFDHVYMMMLSKEVS